MALSASSNSPDAAASAVGLIADVRQELSALASTVAVNSTTRTDEANKQTIKVPLP
jgi:hypothetical protein